MSEDNRLLSKKFKEYDGSLESGAFSVAGSKSSCENGAWWTFASLLTLVTVSGSLWSFGSFSSVFRDPTSSYMYTQTRVELLGAVSVIGNYVVVDSGCIVSSYGTQVGLILGVVLVSLGYFAIWLSVTVLQTEVPFIVFALCFFIYGHGCGTLDNAAVTELVNSFPNHTGSVIGCYKSMYGLSAAVLTLFSALLIESEPHGQILMLSIYAAIIGVVFLPIVHRTNGGQIHERPGRVTAKLFYVACGIAIAAIAVSMFCLRFSSIGLKDAQKIWLVLITTCILGGFALLWLVVLPDGTVSSEAEEMQESRRSVQVDMKVVDMAKSLDFWIFFIMSIVAIGTGVMVLENAGQLLSAFTDSQGLGSVPAFVAVLSCFNCLGRLGSGTVSEWLKDRVPRMYFYVAATLVMASAFVVLAFFGRETVWIAAPLVIFCWGCVWGLLPALVYELFGPENYSIKYAGAVVSGAAGGLLFSSLIAGTLFDAEAMQRNEFPSCYAPACFETSFIIAAVCNVSAGLLGIMLCSRTHQIREVNHTSTR